MSGKYYYEAAPPPVQLIRQQTTQCNNIATMIQNAGGKVALSTIKSDYQKKYGKKIVIPGTTKKEKKIKHYIEKNVPGVKVTGLYCFWVGHTLPPKKKGLQEVDLNTIPKQALCGGGGGDSKKKSNDEKVALCASMRNLHLHQEDEEMEIERDDEVQDVSSEGGNTSENDSNNVEQKLEDDIVEKLMNYAGGKFKPTIVHQDSMSLLDILPMEWADALQDIGMKNVSDISLDLGRRPYCWYNHQRKYLSEDASHVVSERDIHDVVARWTIA